MDNSCLQLVFSHLLMCCYFCFCCALRVFSINSKLDYNLQIGKKWLTWASFLDTPCQHSCLSKVKCMRTHEPKWNTRHITRSKILCRWLMYESKFYRVNLKLCVYWVICYWSHKYFQFLTVLCLWQSKFGTISAVCL